MDHNNLPTMFLALVVAVASVEFGFARAVRAEDSGEATAFAPGQEIVGSSWNAELEGGLVWVNSERHLSVRAQLGRLWAREVKFVSFGGFVERDFGFGDSIGLIATSSESRHGGWQQVGALLDEHGRPGFLLATGTSVIGIEGQRRFGSSVLDRTEWLVELKLRFPIGIGAFVVRERDKKAAAVRTANLPSPGDREPPGID